jgi:hypothetical protein
MRSRAIVTRVIPVVLLSCLLSTSTAAARVMYIVGNISGTVNGTAVNFGLNIRMDMATGEETAAVTRMDPAMGAILRQVTAMVTIAGPTGGSTPQGGKNLFELSGGNFENSASMYWPKTGDQLELVHTVSYTSGDTMSVTATINGTVPIISGADEVVFADFTEIMYWANSTTPAQVVTTGVGFRGDFSNAQFRSYTVGGQPTKGGKGSTTKYNGLPSPGPVLRAARSITTTYDPANRTMNVHLYNTLTPVEPAP